MNTIFSGIQPTGIIHIGNYLGAIKQWVALQKDNSSFFCIVDLHAITASYEPTTLHQQTLDVAAIYLAADLDPERNTIFIQSHVPAHSELAWLLGATTPLGDLNRMTHYKEKSSLQKGQASLGLFSYPVLQAADILLYATNLVPVGEDQVQHVELARGIAKRFNNKFGDTFTIPKAITPGDPASPINHSTTGRIMSLLNPTRKMSKSDSAKSYIALTDGPDIIRQKISAAVTDTDVMFSFSDSGPAITNLLHIYQGFSEEEPQAIEQRFAGHNYSQFKEALAELLIEKLAPLQERYRDIRQNDTTLRLQLGKGKEKAASVANKTLLDVKEKAGLV